MPTWWMERQDQTELSLNAVCCFSTKSFKAVVRKALSQTGTASRMPAVCLHFLLCSDTYFCPVLCKSNSNTLFLTSRFFYNRPFSPLEKHAVKNIKLPPKHFLTSATGEAWDNLRHTWLTSGRHGCPRVGRPTNIAVRLLPSAGLRWRCGISDPKRGNSC